MLHTYEAGIYTIHIVISWRKFELIVVMLRSFSHPLQAPCPSLMLSFQNPLLDAQCIAVDELWSVDLVLALDGS